MLRAALVASLVLAPVVASQEAPLSPLPGFWRAWLECPGGELPFLLQVRSGANGLEVDVLNGGERIAVPEVRVAEGAIELAVPSYDSRIRARLTRGGSGMEGEWEKRRGQDRWVRMPFVAEHRSLNRRPARFRREESPLTRTPPLPPEALEGRWAVRFSSSEDLAVGMFESRAGQLRGTFLTTLGDYRYLEGSWKSPVLRLSCFDFAHAFLFRATAALETDADAETGPPRVVLRGDFWSSDTWHETWEAVRDDAAALPDAFSLSQWTGEVGLDELAFPDLNGKPRSLADPEFAGRARILQLFGSWCPNCNDETAYLAELDERYRDRGLSILGLAFELTDDEQRNAEQVRLYLERHAASFPVLLAGPSDKEAATAAFQALDRVIAYPTTIFLDAEGRVRAVHTGFSGPAAALEHAELRDRFEHLIEELLAEAAE